MADTNCPVCGHNNYGKIGNNQFYCWNCFVEYEVNGPNNITIYEVAEDGSLINYADDAFEFDTTLT